MKLPVLATVYCLFDMLTFIKMPPTTWHLANSPHLPSITSPARSISTLPLHTLITRLFCPLSGGDALNFSALSLVLVSFCVCVPPVPGTTCASSAIFHLPTPLELKTLSLSLPLPLTSFFHLQTYHTSAMSGSAFGSNFNSKQITGHLTLLSVGNY